MRITCLLVLNLLLISFSGLSQTVPHKIDFADMELKLTKDAIKDIQSHVDALTRSDSYFQKQLEKADMYMPIIERIFKEEGLPDDFKYLVIQESALIPDAVSSSNAVGFWQFKEISGLENGLRIDRQVDERMNIVSASHAAANYLKKHNEQFDNWAYTLIAYQRGVAGARSVIDERYFGARKLPITKNTYWYLKKYLAHKVAFENALGTTQPTYYLKEVKDAQGKHLKDIANEENVEQELIEDYNKWLLRGRIPDDKNYTVIVPIDRANSDTPYHNTKKEPTVDLPGKVNQRLQNQYPIIEDKAASKNATIAHEIKVNGLKGIVAAEGYKVESLAEKGGLKASKFRKFNDMSLRQSLEIGEIYYLQRKRNRAKFYYHTVQPGESMWEISQKYGLKLHKLYRKNRMKDPATPKAGRVLWLRLNRPSNIPVEYKEIRMPVKPKQEQEKVIDEKAEIKAPSQKDKSSIQLDSVQTKKEEVAKPINIEPIAETDSTITSVKQDSTNSTMDVSHELDKTPSVDHEVITSDTLKNDTSAIEIDSTQVDTENFEQERENTELMEYTIKKGDTFFSISNRFNMRISDLLNYNDLDIRDTLAIDQKILVNKMVIPDSERQQASDNEDNSSESSSEQKADIEHKISSGETLYSLARKYNVSLKEILEWNNKDDYSIKEGEIIIIKRK
ncbi:hypothetical protein GCM10027429_11810 [Marivirga atlantica]|jgi:membrane-bound lytic murein transglycosylase D|uniref:LysM peptidoglycan-binding domain-containing protein n=1 Tax=Marivirga atlantica TaxID=1548457 RepID=A0A937DJD6_9BACT|nr:LysM peptidoglycan-binding domain-containing protein [Marivirga atlantica]MBL0764794.1 LysM peptidoglycan-binding domain-containing protein [Marivirga atlantica]